jgi:hypothetical protein
VSFKVVFKGLVEFFIAVGMLGCLGALMGLVGVIKVVGGVDGVVMFGVDTLVGGCA